MTLYRLQILLALFDGQLHLLYFALKTLHHTGELLP